MTIRERLRKGSSKMREILSEADSPYLSAGRVGMFICLFASIGFSLLGLKYPESDKVLSYCSLIALQFLGTAVLFYGSSKTSEAFKTKWTPPNTEKPVAKIVQQVAEEIVAVDAEEEVKK